MCMEYEWEYLLQRAEEARKAMREAEEQLKKPKPAAPESVPAPQDREPVPA